MKKLLWPLFYLFVLCFLAHNSFSYLDPDFGWHLRFGEIIWRLKTVPHDQIFMWTLAGKNWVDHEWLANLITFGLWSSGGYLLVSLFFIIIPAGSIFLTNSYLFKNYDFQPPARFMVGFMEIAALFAMRGHIGVRMQEFTILALVLLLIAIDRCRRTGDWKIFAWSIPLMYLWACLHAGFMIGLVVIAAWLIYEWTIGLFPRAAFYLDSSRLGAAALRRLSLVAFIAAASTFATPYGLELYEFIGTLRNTYFANRIQEWLSPYSVPINYPQIIGSFIALILSLGMLLFHKKNTSFNFLLALILIVFASRSMRHFPLMAFAVILLIAPHSIVEFRPAIKRGWTSVIGWISVALLLAASLGLLSKTRFTADPFREYCDNYPCAAISFLKAHPEYVQGHLFNHYNIGGFLIGVWPELRLFIDGRLPQYPLRATSTLEEYGMFDDLQLAPRKLEEYDIQTVFYAKPRPAPSFNWFERHILGLLPDDYAESERLIAYLKKAAGWQLVYEDQKSVIFIRRDQK